MVIIIITGFFVSFVKFDAVGAWSLYGCVRLRFDVYVDFYPARGSDSTCGGCQMVEI